MQRAWRKAVSECLSMLQSSALLHADHCPQPPVPTTLWSTSAHSARLCWL